MRSAGTIWSRFSLGFARFTGKSPVIANQPDLHYSIEQMPLADLTDHCRQLWNGWPPVKRNWARPWSGRIVMIWNFWSTSDRCGSFGSQGQQRSFLLAFKAAQVIDLEAQFSEPPVLLLDDLASELDSGARKVFLIFC